jgi:hypothetical protein
MRADYHTTVAAQTWSERSDSYETIRFSTLATFAALALVRAAKLHHDQ